MCVNVFIILYHNNSKHSIFKVLTIFSCSQSLDEVHIEVETCEDLRDLSSSQGLSSHTGPTKYSFIHKVIDGITVTVNTVSVTFKSPAFIASVKVYSVITLLNPLTANSTQACKMLICSKQALIFCLNCINPKSCTLLNLPFKCWHYMLIAKYFFLVKSK